MKPKLSAKEISAVKSKIAIVKEHCDSCRKHGYPDELSESYLKEWLKYLPEATRAKSRRSKELI